MSRGTRPSHPWSDLGCPPRQLCDFLGGLLRNEDADLVNRLAGGTLSLQAVDALVSRHRVGPFLSLRLEGSPVRAALPEITLQRIDKGAERQMVLAERCLGGLDLLNRAFQAEGLPFVLIKGLEMAQRLFGSVSARGFWDLDLLVREEDRDRTCRLLENQGFTLLSTAFLGERLSATFTHAFDFAREDFKLDLHWCLSRLPGLRLDLTALFERAEWLDIDGLQVRVLNLEDELAFVLISVFADIQCGYLRLQSFIDLFALIQNFPDLDWSAFFVRRQAERSEAMCRAVLGLFLATLNLESAFPALKQALGQTPTADEALNVLEPSQWGGRSKVWASKSLPVSQAYFASWWLVSLPFRVAASHPRFRKQPGKPATRP